MSIFFLAFVAFFWALWPCRTATELTVNVSRNKTNPEIGKIRQSITGNSSTETVTIEFKEADGTLLTVLTDFRTNAQILRLIIPGEEELNEPRAQTICFISSFNNDLISPEAVMKLRQKHPGTVRIADEDMGEIVQDSPLKVGPRASALWISSHLPKMCREAFSSEHELFNILGGNLQKVDATSQKDEGYEDLQRCFSTPSSQENIGGTPCICSRQVWINWYPCALKYCRNHEGDGEHRCGIKTCQKCLTFRYRAKSKLHCSWDEP